jgi:tripartite-type tricarboxylate transporter receptor subunit TctC
MSQSLARRAFLRRAAVLDAAEERGLDAFPVAPAEFAAYIKTEATKWAQVAQASGIKSEFN